MPLSDKTNHLSSNDHKNKTKQQQICCEDCGKNISDKTTPFQSEIQKARAAPHTASRTASHAASQLLPRFYVGTLPGVEVIVNEKTYIKLNVNPTGTASPNLEKHINELLCKITFLDTNIG